MTANYLILSIFTQSDELAWANRVINFQYNMTIWGIIVIIGLAALIAGASWFNYYRFTKHTINSFRSEMDTIKQELILEIENKLKKQSEETKKEIHKLIQYELTDLNAEKSRVFAIVADHIKSYNNATQWWSSAIEGYKKVGRDDLLRRSVDGLIDSLNECQQLTNREIERIVKCLPIIPLVFDVEKKEIEERLTKLKDQVTK